VRHRPRRYHSRLTSLGLAFLRMDHARVKWRIKLSESFQAQSGEVASTGRSKGSLLLFWLPFVTVLREGLEGIVFMGGG
jgi:high-affinity iron transporter